MQKAWRVDMKFAAAGRVAVPAAACLEVLAEVEVVVTIFPDVGPRMLLQVAPLQFFPVLLDWLQDSQGRGHGKVCCMATKQWNSTDELPVGMATRAQ